MKNYDKNRLLFFKLVKEIPEKNIREWAIKYIERNAQRIEDDAGYIVKNIKPAKMLNIGAAPYYLEYLIKKNNPSTPITSFDIEPERFKIVIENIGIKTKKIDIEDLDISNFERFNSKYDLIVFTEILEHLRINILNSLRVLNNMLSVGGTLYLTTPNGMGLFKLLRFFNYRTGPDVITALTNIKSVGHCGHIREYSSKEVCKLLEYCGFNIVSINYRENYQRTLGGKTLNKAVKLVLKIILKTVPFLRHNLVVIAEKK